MPVDPLTAIRQYLAALIERDRAWDQAHEGAALRVEAEGYRLVNGGGGGDMGWVITDHRSGAVLASGTGDMDWDAAWDRLGSEGKPLYHIDRVGDDLPLDPVPESPALPPGLCMALGDWVDRDTGEAAKWLDGLRGEEGDG